MVGIIRAAEADLRALEAVKFYAERYGLRAEAMKPCIACLLDGNLGAAPRHEAAFCIAIELRRMGVEQSEARTIIRDWGWRIGYPKRTAERGVQSAFQREPSGEYKYRPPGLRKQSPRYRNVLAPLCAEIGCPENCLPLMPLYRGPGSETFERFTDLGWPLHLRRRRLRSAVDVYHAVCRLEEARGFAPGSQMFTHYRQLAALAEVDPRTVGRALRNLEELGLVTFKPGRGSGPHARDRVASRVQRIVPIPQPRETQPSTGAITTGGGRPSDTGGGTSRSAARRRQSFRVTRKTMPTE
jgi:hypothetical protein